MKNLYLVMLFLIFVPTIVLAELSPAEARWGLTKTAGGFTAGFISGLVSHELGHEVVARQEGVDIEWSGTNWYADNASASEHRNISIAGFGMQVLSTEIILRSKSIPKDSSYVLGWLTYNIANQILYPLQNELSSSGYKDLANYENYGGNVKVLEVGLIAHAIWSFYRLKNNPDTPLFISVTRNEVRIGLGWDF